MSGFIEIEKLGQHEQIAVGLPSMGYGDGEADLVLRKARQSLHYSIHNSLEVSLSRDLAPVNCCLVHLPTQELPQGCFDFYQVVAAKPKDSNTRLTDYEGQVGPGNLAKAIVIAPSLTDCVEELEKVLSPLFVLFRENGRLDLHVRQIPASSEAIVQIEMAMKMLVDQGFELEDKPSIVMPDDEMGFIVFKAYKNSAKIPESFQEPILSDQPPLFNNNYPVINSNLGKRESEIRPSLPQATTLVYRPQNLPGDAFRGITPRKIIHPNMPFTKGLTPVPRAASQEPLMGFWEAEKRTINEEEPIKIGKPIITNRHCGDCGDKLVETYFDMQDLDNGQVSLAVEQKCPCCGNPFVFDKRELFPKERVIN